MTNKYLQIGTAVVLVALLTLLLDPFMLLMPAPIVMACLLLATALVAVFAGFVVMEQVRDEREATHRLQSGRIAYLAGLMVLTTGLIFEGIAGHVDPWIVIAIATMITAKLLARVWADSNN